MTVQSLMHVQTNADGVLSRRTFLRQVAATGAALGAMSWKDEVTLQAEELRKRGMACILLFMTGGPSQFETFDPKPGTPTGGPTKSMPTAATGIHIAEGWESVAKAMKEIALIRSMTNKEGAHPRAQYQLHTGYIPSGSVKYPTLGSIVASEVGDPDFDLPHFVSIAGGGPLGNAANISSGFLGMRVAPFIVADSRRMPSNVELPRSITDKRFVRRLGVLGELEEEFSRAGGGARVQDHRLLYQNAARMVRSPRLKAFDVSQESDGVRDRYGRTPFGQGCLLARRLVEQGVTFVEVASNGWDTHQDNFNRVAKLRSTVDPAFGALVSDLKERGMLDKTLVIWMGEFGRTPRINAGRNGRDHFPRAFTVALAGGGVKGGQVIGATSAQGTEVAARPVTVPDLFCSFCHALKINPRKENVSGLGRPIKIVDGGQPVLELFA